MTISQMSNNALEEMRRSDSFKVGYMRSAIKLAIECIERDNVAFALHNLKDTILVIDGLKEESSGQ